MKPTYDQVIAVMQTPEHKKFMDELDAFFNAGPTKNNAKFLENERNYSVTLSAEKHLPDNKGDLDEKSNTD